MPNLNYIAKALNIEESFVKNIEEENGQITLFIELPVLPHACPCCKNLTTRIKDYHIRRVVLDYHLKITIVGEYRQRRYHCPHCGKAFNEKNPFVARYQRQSRRRIEAILEDTLEMQSFSMIARRFKISASSVIRYFDQLQYPKPNRLPTILGIDEFKGNASGQKYQVILTNVRHHKIFDVLPERKTDKIIAYFKTFSLRERAKVEAVVMDLCPMFRSIVQECFPNARIIGDRYHIFRLVLWSMENVRKSEQNKLYPAHSSLKQNRRLLRKNLASLKDFELSKLMRIAHISPRLGHAYYLKERFLKIKEFKGRKAINRFLDKWLEEVRNGKLAGFKNLLTSFEVWREPIVEAILSKYSNGYTEGCNNKIKVMKRISYGVRNFKRFRNRILYINQVTQKMRNNAS